MKSVETVLEKSNEVYVFLDVKTKLMGKHFDIVYRHGDRVFVSETYEDRYDRQFSPIGHVFVYGYQYEESQGYVSTGICKVCNDLLIKRKMLEKHPKLNTQYKSAIDHNFHVFELLNIKDLTVLRSDA